MKILVTGGAEFIGSNFYAQEVMRRGEAIGDVWGMMSLGEINDYAKRGDEEIKSSK